MWSTRTETHPCITRNRPEITDLLLSRGAAVDAVNNDKCNALHEAAFKGQREICTLLLDAGASLHVVDKNGNTPLHFAALSKRPEITDLLLSRGAAVNAVNNDRRSALHVAALNGPREHCTLLLDAGASLHVVDGAGDTPLHCAALGNQSEITDLLLSRGASVGVVDNYGFSALHVATLKSQRELCILLLDAGASLHMINVQGNTPLHCAAIGATKKLVTRARHLVDVKMEDGFAALHVAALLGCREVAAILLSQNGGRATVDLRNNLEETPLHIATRNEHWPLVELLVYHNADVGSIKDGNTVLHIACFIAKSQNQQSVVPTPESSRDSPLIYGIWQNLARQGAQTELALVCFLIRADKSCKLLMQVRNNKNMTPFDLLEDKQQIAVLAYFLGFYKCQGYNTQLEIENNPSNSSVKPPAYRIVNISQLERLPGVRKNIARFGDAAEYRDCLGIITENRTNQENRIDLNSSTTLVGYDHTVVMTQTIQDDHLTTDEVISNPDKSKDVSSEIKQKEEISDREKEKDKGLEPLTLQIFRYLGNKIADMEEANMCSICVERRRNVVFLCGHCACDLCAVQLNTCHICRKTITKIIDLY
ncbi:PREDICTED: E3 ubiquitin-protein ligase mib1-like [Wasmannia auropunctata]|uniref:E3 ubiquitin-protein ligase mib1-like n=1 Tax=Wasmannia auropunctata TaxID=64793 RepID=UPI0005EF1431|nr:PREDICTED: E3 ubiquitin-protein ligase mib1-like [Wasmannia auropunctata]